MYNRGRLRRNGGGAAKRVMGVLYIGRIKVAVWGGGAGIYAVETLLAYFHESEKWKGTRDKTREKQRRDAEAVRGKVEKIEGIRVVK